MGASAGRPSDTSAGSDDTGGPKPPQVAVTLEDLELPPRRSAPPGAAEALAQLAAAGAAGGGNAAAGMPGTTTLPGGMTGAPAAPVAAVTTITEEIIPGSEAKGQKAFREDGLIGTEQQQLQLLAHYAELCEDFRLYQRTTRSEGAPRDVDGAQLLLLSGPPGTGKTRHAVTFAKALGLPLLVATPPAGSGSATGWAAQLRRELKGRDCAVFFDEIDQHVTEESFASTIRQFLDGVCQPSDSRVLLVGTTNRLDRLPKDVLHRAEVIHFDRPEAPHLETMWASYAQHLREPELRELGEASAKAGATGRDVRHCAALCERQAAIRFLNVQNRQGYCHGNALANCPSPALAEYVRCVKGRAQVE